SVAAELHKAAGAKLVLALPAGSYEATGRANGKVSSWALSLANGNVTALDLGACRIVSESGAPKGAGDDVPDNGQETRPEAAVVEVSTKREIDRWSVESTVGFIARTGDEYTDRLGEFGYQRKTDFINVPSARLTLGVAREMAPHISVLLQ